MQIGFEAKRFFSNYTGLGNYARFVVSALSEFAPENQYTLYTPYSRNHPEVNSIVARENVRVVEPSGTYKSFKGLWRSWGVSRDPSIQPLNVFHGLSQELPMGLPSHVAKIVTIHDLIYLRYPQFYNPIDAAIYKAKVKWACRAADKIIAISNQTAEDIVDFLKVDRAKIEVVYQGCHPNFKRKVGEQEKFSVQLKYSLPSEFILTVGTIEERKNVKLLVKSLARLPEADRLPIVMMGRATPYKKEVVQCAIENKVLDKIIFLHDASFDDFPAIYQLAKVFVYPSLFEGFGIPLVEAIESGVPVITSVGSCFREAGGSASSYVDPHSELELADRLQKILHDNGLRQRMVVESQQFIKKFRPEIIASDLLKIYTLQSE